MSAAPVGGGERDLRRFKMEQNGVTYEYEGYVEFDEDNRADGVSFIITPVGWVVGKTADGAVVSTAYYSPQPVSLTWDDFNAREATR